MIIHSGEYLPEALNKNKAKLTMRPMSGIVRNSNRPPISRHLAKVTGGTQSRDLTSEVYKTKFREKSAEGNSDSSLGRNAGLMTVKQGHVMADVYNNYRGDGQLLISRSDNLDINARGLK